MAKFIGIYKQRRIQLIALLMMGISLGIPVLWFYQLIKANLGGTHNFIAWCTITCSILVVAFTSIVSFAIVYGCVKRQQHGQKQSLIHGTSFDPSVLRYWGRSIYQYPEGPPISGAFEHYEGNEETLPLSLLGNQRRKGKMSKYSYERQLKAVLKWERRNPYSCSMTLEQFLGREFGETHDGIPFVAPTTFYGWRKRILKEIEQAKQVVDLNPKS